MTFAHVGKYTTLADVARGVSTGAAQLGENAYTVSANPQGDGFGM